MLLSTLLLVGLPFNRGIFLVKQNIILHIIERVKKTQVKVFSEEADLLDGFIKVFLMLLHSLFLYIISSSSSSLLASFSLATRSLDSDSFSWAFKSATALESLSFSIAMPSTWPAKSFFSSARPCDLQTAHHRPTWGTTTWLKHCQPWKIVGGSTSQLQ